MTLAEQLEATAELCGTKLSHNAAMLLALELSEYPEEQVKVALQRCRRELKTRLTIAEVVSRIDDGRPGPDEAWASLPWDEVSSALLTEEMCQAQGIARAAYEAGDRVGARFAFREAYVRLVAEARARKEPVQWTPSLGTDVAGREGVLKQAVQRQQLAAERAQALLPPGKMDGSESSDVGTSGQQPKRIAAKPTAIFGTLRQVMEEYKLHPERFETGKATKEGPDGDP